MARLSPIVDNFIILRERYLSKCAPDEIDSIDASLNSLRVNWNAVNLEFKTRFARYEKSSSTWKQFHHDLKELTLWLTKAENRLAETKYASGEINVELAIQEQHVCLSFSIENSFHALGHMFSQSNFTDQCILLNSFDYYLFYLILVLQFCLSLSF